MSNEIASTGRKAFILINYFFLLVMNACFYFVHNNREMTHLVDALGITSLLIVTVTFIPGHMKSGLWKLTHSRTEILDERQLQVTHNAISRSYGIFAIVCLVIMLLHAVLYRLVPGVNFIITVPLAVSLIYLAHTLPASILTWTETEVPGDLQ